MSKKVTVWISRAFEDSTRAKSFTSNTYIEDKQKAFDAARRYRRGEPMPAERFPSELYANYPSWENRQPHLFQAGGAWIVSEECAEVLRRFDLGKTALYPVRIFQQDRTTRVEGEYFCLAFGETKTAFLPEHSPKVEQYGPGTRNPEMWWQRWTLEYDDLAVSETALSGTDLWIDTQFNGAFFLSDRLAKALRAAKVSRPFGLRRCRVIHKN